MKKIIVASILLALFPGAARAAGDKAVTTGTASAAIVAPLTLVHIVGNQLSFGTFSAATSGTVTVSPSTGAGTTSGGVVFAVGSNTTDDYFDVTGQTYQAMNIATTGGTVRSGGNSMSFTTVPILSAGQIATIGTYATAFFTVGGTLNASASQPAGTYTGTYSVTVTYQ